MRLTGLSRRQVGRAAAGAALAVLGGVRVPARAKSTTHHIAIRRFAFDPATLTVRPGDRVEWTNHDIAPHTATDRDGVWDTGELARGESGSLELLEPGPVAYFCAFHPHMTGRITVTSS